MLTFLAAGWLLAAQATDPARDRLDIIAAYQGGWRAVIERRDTEFSHAGRDERRIDNDCRRAGAFYLCSQSVNGAQTALLAYRWDDHRQAYDSYSIATGGGAPGHGTLVIDGDEWRYPWDQPVAGTVIHFRVVNRFVGRDRIEYRREFSRDGRTWTTMEQGVETKIDQGA